MLETKSFDMPVEDLDDFARLTEQESYSIEGQVKKMQLVEDIIRTRFDRKRQALANDLQKNRGLHGAELDAELQRSCQKIRITRMELGDGRFNLIIEKGEGDSDDGFDPSFFRVMIPAHVDTVQSGARTELDQDLQHPDRLTGLGVYDMTQGVLNSIALAVDVQVPKGLKVYFTFTVDEEMHSAGAAELVSQWEAWPHIRCVLSSEIGPLPPQPEGSNGMRLITSRAGRVKFIGNLSIDPRSQGHGAQDDLPSAGHALREWQNLLEDRFYHGYRASDDVEHEPLQQRVHALLGREKIEDGPYSAEKTRKGYMDTDRARFEFALKMVPPSSIDEYVAHIRRWSKGIAKRGQWQQFGISHTINQNHAETSYSPYEMPSDHPFVVIASETIRRLTGVAPEITGAPSVADECLYAEELRGEHASFQGLHKGIITIPVNGDKAHHPDEWVSKRSVMRVRAVMRMLLEDPHGFSSLMKKT